MCSLFAATYPDKTEALVMIGSYARRLRDVDYPWGPTPAERDAFCNTLLNEWGGPVGIEERAPSLAHDAEFRDWWSAYLRMGASPGAAVALTRMNAEIDVRAVLPSVRVPTLVLHRSGDRCLHVEEGRYLASHIPGAEFVALPGEDHLPFAGDQEAVLGEIERFLALGRVRRTPVRLLGSVLTVSPPARIDARFRGIYEREVEWYRGVPLGGEGFTRDVRRPRARGAVRRGDRGRVRAAAARRRSHRRTGSSGVERDGCECQPPSRAGRRAGRSARLADDRRPGAGLRALLR